MNISFATIGFLTMDLSFKILPVKVAMIWWCLNISDIAIITIKGVDFRCIIYDISKSEAIYLLKYSIKSSLVKTHIK